MHRLKLAIVLALSLALPGMALDKSTCKNLEKDVKSTFEKCKKIGKGNSGYNQCKSDFEKKKLNYEQGCLQAGSNIDEQIKQWSGIVKTCKGKQSDRCATALKKLGQLNYQKETQDNIVCQENFDKAYQKWEDHDRKGKPPAECKRTYDKSLENFERFLAQYPKDKSYPNVLMQTSFIYMTQMRDDDAYKLWKKLVEDYSSSSLLPQAWLRIGEYHYNNRKWKDAIEAYQKVAGFENLKGKEAALAIYHKGECYNNQGEYLLSAQTFYEYVVGADQGKYPADLRVEALTYMAGAFADLDDGIDQAEKFLKKKNVSWRDTLFFEIGMKNKSRDRLDEAVYSFKRLLEISPTYVDAPIADIEMINIMIEKKRYDEAQEARKRLVKAYDKSSKWYAKNGSNKQAVETADKAIRAAYFEIPKYYHGKGDKAWNAGNPNEARDEFKKAIAAYNDFLRIFPEPSWDEYLIHTYLAAIQMTTKDFPGAAKEYEWLEAADTVKYGRKPQGMEVTISRAEAAYNAVVAMDSYRDQGLKSVNGDDKKAYTLPQTKAYLAQVDKYMAKYGTDPNNKEAANLAYNAALVHYNGENYKTSVEVLSKLKQTYPKHEYIKEIRGALAMSYTQNGQLDEAEAEYNELLKLYQPSDTMYASIERSIAAVKFQKAEKLVKNKQYEQGAVAYLELLKRFPTMEFSDKALYEAAYAYEQAGKYNEAAGTYMRMPAEYSKSPLVVRSILAAARVYKLGKDYKKAGQTFLFLTNRFPQDSMAFKAIGFAATTYDSIPDKPLAARTYELALQKYPDHPQTPSYLFNACLTYEEAAMVEDAIRCNKTLASKYKNSSYALDAAFSIPKAYEAGKRWEEASVAWVDFTKNFTADKEKLIAAHYGAATSYQKLKKHNEEMDQWKKLLDNYDKYGLKLNIASGVAAEASYMLAEDKKAGFMPKQIQGNSKQKEKAFKDLGNELQTVVSAYVRSAAYNSEKWTFRATNEIGYLFVEMSAKVRNQSFEGNAEKVFVERIGVVQTLPTFYEQARSFFEKNIQLAREQGYYNEDVIAAEEGFIEMFYRDAANFDEVADAFRNAPRPDFSDIEDPDEAAAAEEEYEAALMEKATTAEEGGIPRWESCIKASAHYGIDNKWTAQCRERLVQLRPDNEVAAMKIAKFDPSTLFRDVAWNKNKSRIEQMMASTVMTPGEKYETLKKMIAEAKAAQEKLIKERDELRAKLAPQTPAAGAAAAEE